MIKHGIFLVALLICATLASEAANDNAASRIYTLIYEQNLKEAEALFLAEEDQLSDFDKLYLKFDIYWWKFRTTDEKENSKKMDKLIKSSIDKKPATYQDKMQQIVVRSYQLRYEKTKLNVFAMGSARSKIKDLIEGIKKEDPAFSNEEQQLFNLVLTMYDYIENVNFSAKSKKSAKRLEKLEHMEKYASNENVIVNTVARFFLARMYQKVEGEFEIALEHYKLLTAKFPTNKTWAGYQKECEQKL